MTAKDHLACELLERSRLWVKTKSFEGDQAIDYTTKWEWCVAMCTAIGILNDCISQLRMEEEGFDA